MAPTAPAVADPNAWAPELDAANQAKQQRMHTAVFGGPMGYGETKAPMYVGQELSPGFMQSYENTPPEQRGQIDQWIAQHGWVTPEQANAERWRILQRQGWQGDVPAGMPGGPPAPVGGAAGTGTGAMPGGGFAGTPGAPTGNTGLEQQIQSTLNQYLQGGPGSSPALAAAQRNFELNVLPTLQNQMTLAGVAESPLAVKMYGDVLAGQMVPLIQSDMANQLAAAQQGAALSGQQFQQGFLPWQAAGQSALTREQMAQSRELELASQALQREMARRQAELTASGQQIERELGMGAQGVQRELGLGGQAIERELGLGQLGQQGAISAAQIADAQARRQLDAYGLAGNLMLGLSNPYSAAMQGQLGQQQTGLSALSQFGGLQQGTAQQVLDQMRLEYLRQQGLAENMSTGLFGGATLPPAIGQTSSTSGSTSK